MLLSNPYVIVISLDFSKAFDTVRHSTLLEKLAQLDTPDEVYNWLVDFFRGHAHCTVYRNQMSTLKSINASIIQGSAIGPAACVVNAGDLHTLTPTTSSSNSLMIPISSYLPATSTRGPPKSTTLRRGQVQTT